MKKYFATVNIILKKDVIFEHDTENKDLESVAQLCALRSLGLQLDDSVRDCDVIELDYARNSDPITPMYGEEPIQEYLHAAFAMQDLLAQQNSGIIISGTSNPGAMRQVVELSQKMWDARKKIGNVAVEADLDPS